jgi:NTE family protein
MRALVLSGGASKGAYEVGALKYLIKDLKIKYDILCGVSVGALNVSHISMYTKDEQEIALDNLINVWTNISTPAVRKNWFPFRELSFLWKSSLYNSQPLIDLVHKNLNLDIIRKSGVKVAVGSVCLNNTNYKAFTQDDNEFIEGVLASASYPTGLLPITINDQLYSDGGLRHVIPIQEAIDMGAEDIDIIICQPNEDSSTFEPGSGINFGVRCLDIMENQIIKSDVKMIQLYNKLVNAGLAPDKRYLNVHIIRPAENLPFSSLEFDHDSIMKMIDIGYEDAKKQY